ncbi:MAG: hypothetical protein KDD64_05105 [Bdellovibrionales bacterium]|nr:hypothetical protein [Bdellovibrionales bacterium]
MVLFQKRSVLSVGRSFWSCHNPPAGNSRREPKACGSSLLLTCFLLALFCLLSPLQTFADDEDIQRSPKPGWGNFDVVEQETERPTWQHILLWPVNRVADLLDVFRIDIGGGNAKGAVVRITEYGNIGYREIDPKSVRLGLFGRRAPYLVERSSEHGIGPSYTMSHERTQCPGEVGIGIDLYVGAYGGICVDELADFVLGIFFLDFKDDDIR